MAFGVCNKCKREGADPKCFIHASRSESLRTKAGVHSALRDSPALTKSISRSFNPRVIRFLWYGASSHHSAAGGQPAGELPRRNRVDRMDDPGDGEI
jgi:hypothetical protein